jgi:hypothetical protein
LFANSAALLTSTSIFPSVVVFPDQRMRFSFGSDIGPDRNTVGTLLG